MLAIKITKELVLIASAAVAVSSASFAAYSDASNGLDSPLSAIFKPIDFDKLSAKQQDKVNVSDKANDNKPSKDYSSTMSKYDSTVTMITSNELKKLIANNSTFLLYVRTGSSSTVSSAVEAGAKAQDKKILSIDASDIHNLAFQDQTNVSTTQQNISYFVDGVPKNAFYPDVVKSDKPMSQLISDWLVKQQY